MSAQGSQGRAEALQVHSKPDRSQPSWRWLALFQSFQLSGYSCTTAAIPGSASSGVVGSALASRCIARHSSDSLSFSDLVPDAGACVQLPLVLWSIRGHEPRLERRIVKLRYCRRWGPHRISYHLGVPRSTVGRVLNRYRMPLLAHLDQATGLPVRRPKPVRYEAAAPGDLVHVDINQVFALLPQGMDLSTPALDVFFPPA